MLRDTRAARAPAGYPPPRPRAAWEERTARRPRQLTPLEHGAPGCEAVRGPNHGCCRVHNVSFGMNLRGVYEAGGSGIACKRRQPQPMPGALQRDPGSGYPGLSRSSEICRQGGQTCVGVRGICHSVEGRNLDAVGIHHQCRRAHAAPKDATTIRLLFRDAVDVLNRHEGGPGLHLFIVAHDESRGVDRMLLDIVEDARFPELQRVRLGRRHLVAGCS
eukprot:scaffold977_cov253-Pinguiococcus_pyrenoidosus.AAC.23